MILKALTPSPVAAYQVLSAGSGRSRGPRDSKCETKLRFRLAWGPTLGLHPPAPRPPASTTGDPSGVASGRRSEAPPAGASCRPLGGCARAAARAHAADRRRLLGLAAVAAACRRRSSATTATVVLRGSRRPDARQVALSHLLPGSPLCLRVCFFVQWCDSRRRVHTTGAGWRRRQQFFSFDRRGGWPGSRLRVGDVLTCTAEATPTTWCVATSARCCLPVVGRG